VPGVQVTVERVAAIPRGPNGKFEFIAIAGAVRDEACASAESDDV
jgi:hypothetical protein